jgi:NAD(P) transhydrogenase
MYQVIEHELFVVRDQLERNGVDVYEGDAQFCDPHSINIVSGFDQHVIRGDKILVACGSKPARPAHIPFDGQRIFDSDDVLYIDTIPRSMVVIGGGVIGIEYAIMFAILGVRVTLIDGRERLLEFCDAEIIDTLMFNARGLGITFRLGENVSAVRPLNDDTVVVELESHKRIVAHTALFSVGRSGDTESLNAGAAGLSIDKRGRIECDQDHRTSVPHIYAVGDVVGFPALASTAMEQGRRAVCFMFDQPFERSTSMPYGLYTIPELSMVGKTEKELTQAQIPYEIGVARFNEIARGQIVGDHSGMLKLLFHRETRAILGVHCIGETATEIIHIGQAVMALGGTIDYFCNTVFNFPTMTECYKVAAFDGVNRLSSPEQSTKPASSNAPILLVDEVSSAPTLAVL